MIGIISFTIEGNPVPLARPVICRRGRSSGRVWLRDPDAAKKATFRSAVRDELFGEGDEGQILFPSNLPIEVDITFYMLPPKTHFVGSNREQGQLKQGAVDLWPSRPDIDNLDKFILDSLQGFLFDNDAQVVEQHICKVYDHQPPYLGRTKVTIRPATIGHHSAP